MRRLFSTLATLVLILTIVSPLHASTIEAPIGYTALALPTDDTSILCRSYIDQPLNTPGVVGVPTRSLANWKQDPTLSNAVNGSAQLKDILAFTFSYGKTIVSSLNLESLVILDPPNITDCPLGHGRFVSRALKVGSLTSTVTQSTCAPQAAVTTPQPVAPGSAGIASAATSALAAPPAVVKDLAPAPVQSCAPNGAKFVVCPTDGGDVTTLFAPQIKAALLGICKAIGNPSLNIASQHGSTTIETGADLIFAVQLMDTNVIPHRGRTNLTSGAWNSSMQTYLFDRNRPSGYIVSAAQLTPDMYWNSPDRRHLGHRFCLGLTVAQTITPSVNSTTIICPPIDNITAAAIDQPKLSTFIPSLAPESSKMQSRSSLFYFDVHGSTTELTTTTLSTNQPAMFTFYPYQFNGVPPLRSAFASLVLTETVYAVH